jgi:hypothetical protein
VHGINVDIGALCAVDLHPHILFIDSRVIK